MSDEQSGAASVNAAVARAMIRAMGMQAENLRVAFYGQPPAYDEGKFLELINDEAIDWNSVVDATR